VPLIASIPLDPFMVEGGDDGSPVVRTNPGSPAAVAVTEGAKRVVELVPPAESETCTARVDRLIEGLKAKA
jgi:PHD/YefM family antitoxin component YafN of YafNO toxin-antitoxin module